MYWFIRGISLICLFLRFWYWILELIRQCGTFSLLFILFLYFFYVVLCRSFFVPLSFFFWPLHCLSFDLRLLIIPVVSSNLTLLMGGLPDKYVLSDCHKYQQDFTVGKVNLKSDSTHHFFRNACTKSWSLRFSKFSGCWLILSVYKLMSFDFPFVRLLGVR